jgi:glycosyltransferase involved in cell wall biosynthesis
LENILEAAKRLTDNKDILLVIVGEGLKKNELEDKAKKLDLKNVLFLPFQPYEDLPHLLGSADILFVPLDEEKSLLSVPSKLYNFLASGRPIMGLAHEDSEVKKLIESTNSGVCVSPGDIEKIADTIKELNRSRGRLKEMADNARRLAVEVYSKDKVLKDMEKYIFGLQ